MTQPTHAPACPTSPLPPTTALAASAGRLRRRLPRTALLMLLLCSAIALLLNAFDLAGLGVKLIYSFAIGGCCWVVNESGTLLQAAASDAWRGLRRQPLSAGGFDHGWRGKIWSTLACIAIGPLLGMALGDSITGFNSPRLWELGASNSRVTLVVTVLASVLTVSVIGSMERLASARAQAEAAQRLASDTRLRLLQSQLEPHMLFNTLANLRVLIGLDAARAQAMLDHLISFLRATLQASRAGEHPLASEFDRIADYLALMAVRMGPRLRVQLDLPDALRAVPVPALLLQPLVENSIQHGLEPQVQGGSVRVAARREGDMLVLTVRDTGVGCNASGRAGVNPGATTSSATSTSAAAERAARGRPAGGFGLAGTRERLQTLYGQRASLQLADVEGPQGGNGADAHTGADRDRDRDSGTLATLRLPIADAPHLPPSASASTPAPTSTPAPARTPAT